LIGTTAGPPAQAVRVRAAAARWALVRRHPDLVAGALFLGAATLYYYPLVFLGRAVADYDAFVFFYPQRAYLADALRAGRLPLWDPLLFMGAPFLANPQTAVLYPPSWLFVLGPVHVVYTLQLVLHVFLGGWFMYLFAAHGLGARRPAAAVGGLAYAFGGFAVGQTGHLNQLSAAAWLPLVLLAYDRAVATGRPCWVGVGALALGVQLLAGHPQVVYLTLIALGLFGLVRAPWRRPWRLAWAAGAAVLLGVAAAAVAAAQLLPTLELTPLSIRGAGVRWDDAVAGSLPSSLLPRALLPPFWLDSGSTEYLGYVGVVPLTLGVLALLFARSRFVVFGLLLCALGVCLALGQYNGWYRWAFDSVPQFGTFRVPARWLFLWQVGASVLAALGADWVARGARVPSPIPGSGWEPTRVWLRRPDLWVRVVLVALLLATAAAWQRDYGLPVPVRRTALVWGGLALVTLGAGALATSRRPGRLLASGLLLGATVAELFAAASASPARQAPPALFDSPGVAADWLLREGDPAARSLSAAHAEYVARTEDQARAALGPLPEGTVRALLVAWKWRDTLAPNEPLQFGLRSVDGYDGGVLPLQRFVDLSALIVPSPRADGVLQSRLDRLPDARLLDLLGVRYVLTNAGAPALANARAVPLGDVALYDRAAAPPLSRLVYQAGPPLADEPALRRLAEPTFDPDNTLLLAPEPGAVALNSGRPGQAVTPQAADAERWRAHLSLPEAGYLLQREAMYPGWQARVDGRDAPVVRADVLFRAVPVPAGEHDVEIFFDSGAFRRGALVSLVGLLAVVGLLTSPVWRRFVPRMPHGSAARAHR
jgi:Bacterial membrane protein YfhO